MRPAYFFLVKFVKKRITRQKKHIVYEDTPGGEQVYDGIFEMSIYRNALPF